MKQKCIVLLLLALVAFFWACSSPDTADNTRAYGAVDIFPTPERPAGQEDVVELRSEPIDTVRMAIIGLGMRGSGAVHRYTFMEGVQIRALCDLESVNVEKAQQMLQDRGFPLADAYVGPEAYKEICQRDDIDLVYVCTNWAMHTPIAVYAMEHGKHVATEVPAALTIEECWQLVNTAERTRRHCMQLENCNYDFFEMATLNMARQGLFGEILHGEGAYIHDLRHLNFAEYEPGRGGAYHNMWRLGHMEKRDGNLYPTHGFGPICHIMNIHRGDRMSHIVAMSSRQAGMSAYASERYGAESDYANREYRKGDMNTSLVRTVKGKTILIQHDVTSPRPYSRIHLLSGTKGFARKWPVRGLAFDPGAHHFLSEEEMEKVLAEYEHPITKEVGEKAREVGGHGGMDFIMDYRLIYCLRNGLPLDQDVYDAAEWSAISELSEKSVEYESMPVKVPDFTRGAWKKVEQVTYYQ